MFRVHAASWLAPNVRRVEVEAPRVAARHLPGNFVIVRAHADGERIPLTVGGVSRDRGTVTLVIQNVGATTARLCALRVGDSIPDVVGPLGRSIDSLPSIGTGRQSERLPIRS